MTSQPPPQLSSPVAAQRMVEAAARWVGLLSPAQHAVACFPLAGEECFRWQYTPGPRGGLWLKDMTRTQQTAALELFDAGLSVRGGAQARAIITLETLLGETERLTGNLSPDDRDPGLYYFSIFGHPAGANVWRWRANGHHLALHFTMAGGNVIAATPLFFGANPAEVQYGPATGGRILAEEEDLARALLATLQPTQKTVAIVGGTAPADILTRNYRRADPAAVPDGIRLAALAGEQRTRLVALVRHYTRRVCDEVAEQAWSRMEDAGLDAITFAWAGGEVRGAAHYYCITGPTFLIEYDNSQNDANHIHSVWRDVTNDWGLDVLAQHYAGQHGPGRSHDPA